MENISPLDHIPDKWLEKSRCPVCLLAPMKISHYDWEPDQFVCENCGIHFQVAKNNPSIFIFQEPIDEPTGYLGQWIEMKVLIQESRTKSEMRKSVPVSPVQAQMNDSPEEIEEERPHDPIYEKYPASVIDSAASLYEMGNSRQAIKSTLIRNSELSEDDIKEIVNHVTRQKRKKEKVSFKLPRWAIGCITVPVFLLISYLLIMLYFQYSFAKRLAEAPGAIEYTLVDFEKLPAIIQGEIPEDVREMQMPKAKVTKFPSTNLPQAICPTNVQSAISLFGGQASDWTYRADQNAWTLQSTYLRTLNLPQDYIAVMPSLNHGLILQLASGPASIQNAYLVMIRCP